MSKDAYLLLYGNIPNLVAIEMGNPEYIEFVEPKTKKSSLKRPAASLKRPAACMEVGA